MAKISHFAVRFTNLDRDVLVIKGAPDQANPALCQGKVVLVVSEPTHFRRLSLRLTATMIIDQVETAPVGLGQRNRQIRFDRVLYDHTWDDQELTEELIRQLEQKLPAPAVLRNKSLSQLSSLGLFTSLLRNSSTTTLLGMGKQNPLNVGAYEVPFKAVLPGLIPETVEGLPGGSVVYRIVASLDKSAKLSSSHVTAKKRFRVVRTLTVDSVELSDSVAVDNTWPGKVEYSLNVPAKAAAIGLGFPVLFNLVPLVKGLRLGNIRMELLEEFTYVNNSPPPYNGERSVCHKTIKAPPVQEFDDHWDVTSFLQIPPSLAKCTQDCNIENMLKVRHKIKVVIALINADGHTLELRASMPVQLFISPFVTIQGQLDMWLPLNRLQHYRDGEDEPEETLFRGQDTTTGANNGNNASSGIVAPPQYQNHIYDRLWSDVLPVESPAGSGAATPLPALSSLEHVNLMFQMHTIDTQLLHDRLRSLDVTCDHSGDDDYFTVGGRRLNPALALATPQRSMLLTPLHLSRVNSLTNVSGDELSRVPLYLEAMRLSSLTDLSPAYIPPATTRPRIAVTTSSDSGIGGSTPGGNLGARTRSQRSLTSLGSSLPTMLRSALLLGIPIISLASRSTSRRQLHSPVGSHGSNVVFTMTPSSHSPPVLSEMPTKRRGLRNANVSN